MSENFALLFCAYFCGVHDPGVPGEKGRLIVILPLREYMWIKESQVLIESGNLLGSESLVHSVFGKKPSASCIFWNEPAKSCNVYSMQTEGSATLTTKKLKLSAVF